MSDPVALDAEPRVPADPRTQLRAHLERMRRIGIRYLPSTGAAAGADVLGKMEREVDACRKCPIGHSRANAVFGSGNPHADLLLVGEAPGMEEDRRGLPFVGQAGALLTRIIEAMDLRRDDVFITNILKCRPPGNRDPEPQEILNCSPYLRRQIEAIQPRVICALGGFAARTLLENREGITRLRGRFHDLRGVPVMPTYHPAYLLRNPSAKRAVWDDVKKIRDLLSQKPEIL